MEEGRVSVRNVRRDANHQLKDIQTGKHISEDEIRRSENDIQTMTDRHINELKTVQEQKEKELIKV